MTQLHILQNNFVNNGFVKKFPSDHFDHPNGQDWRGFMFYLDCKDGKERLMTVVHGTTDYDWKLKDTAGDYTSWADQKELSEIYVSMLHEWIEENGGIS